jgi:diguanylate cyclase (GGDEF)-like protein
MEAELGGTPTPATLDRGGAAQVVTGSRPRAARALRGLAPSLVALLGDALEGRRVLDPTQAEPLARTILQEFEHLLVDGALDSETITAIAKAHLHYGVPVALVDAAYRLVIEGLRDAVNPETLLAVREHQVLLLARTHELFLELAESREQLRQTMVELSNSFEHLVEADEETVLRQIVDLVQRASGAPLVYFGIALGTAATGFSPEVTVAAVAGPAAGYVEDLTLSTRADELAGQGPVGIALRSNRVTIRVHSHDPRFRAWNERLDRERLGSEIAVPVAISLNRTGVLVLYRRMEEYRADEIEDVMGALGAELDRLFARRVLWRQERRLEAIDDLVRRIDALSDTDWAEVMSEVAEGLVEADVAQAAALMGVDHERIAPLGAWGALSRGAHEELARLELGLEDERRPLVRAVLGREVVVSNGIATDQRAELDELRELLAQGALVARIPVVLRDEVRGVLVVALEDGSDRGFGQRLVDRVVALVHLGAARVERNLSEFENRWLHNLTRTVLESTSALVLARSEAELLQSFCEALVTESVFTSCWVAAPSQQLGRLVPLASAGLGASEVRRLEVPLDFPGEGPLVLRALRHDRIFYNQDELHDQEVSPWLDFLQTFAWNCGVSIPVHKDGRVYAALTVMSKVTNSVTPAVLSLLETVARMIEQGLGDLTLKRSLAEEQDRQRRAAHTDQLTGLPNRLAFEEGVSELLARGREVTVGILDLDGFKDLNDTAGHAAGDRFLEQLGTSLRATVVSPDFVARLGGDEFGFCLVDAGSYQIDEFVGQVQELVIEVGQHYRITASLGWACSITDGRSYSDLLVRADEALYAAKAAGKARSMSFFGEVARSVELRRQVREGLPRAIAAGEVRFVVQPKVEASLGKVIGVELLMRWGGAPLGAVLKELRADASLAREFGRYVIEQAVATRAQLVEAGRPEVAVALNVTPSHFLSEAFLDDVDPLTWGDPWSYTVEITEDVALDDLETARRVIDWLHAHRVAVSLDDFGTGYASLSNLASLDVDEIKIDRSFISRFGMDANSFAVVSSLTFLARLAGIMVVAEGVETYDELWRWMGLGGRLVQGYFFTRPLDLEDLLRQLEIGFGVYKPAVFQVEDRLLLNDALVLAHLDGRTDLRACPFPPWFATRAERWGHLESFSYARSLHETLHEGRHHADPYHGLASLWASAIERLRNEIAVEEDGGA